VPLTHGLTIGTAGFYGPLDASGEVTIGYGMVEPEWGKGYGTEAVAGGRTLVKAEIPELEVTRYAIDLRSMSHGTGSFSRSYLRYEPLPSHLADKVVSASKKE